MNFQKAKNEQIRLEEATEKFFEISPYSFSINNVQQYQVKEVEMSQPAGKNIIFDLGKLKERI